MRNLLNITDVPKVQGSSVASKSYITSLKIVNNHLKEKLTAFVVYDFVN